MQCKANTDTNDNNELTDIHTSAACPAAMSAPIIKVLISLNLYLIKVKINFRKKTETLFTAGKNNEMLIDRPIDICLRSRPGSPNVVHQCLCPSVTMMPK